MSYAILNNTPGEAPQYAYVNDGDDLYPGEAFRHFGNEDIAHLVVRDDGLGLREKTQIENDAQALTLAKTTRLAQIQQAYGNAIERPVSVLGFDWKGGESSAAAIGGAIDLAEALGQADVELWPNHDTQGRMMTPIDAKQIVAAVGVQFQQDFKLRKTARGLVLAATTVAEAESVAIPAAWL